MNTPHYMHVIGYFIIPQNEKSSKEMGKAPVGEKNQTNGVNAVEK